MLLILIINKIQEFCIHLFQINHLVAYYKFLQKNVKTFNSECQDIRVWFTDQDSQPLEIEDNKFNSNN